MSQTQARSAETASRYTLGELMVARAAREIRDGEVVFVGMRLPLLAFVVAKKTHAPNAVGLFENGVIRATPAHELIYTMADPPNILGATQCRASGKRGRRIWRPYIRGSKWTIS